MEEVRQLVQEEGREARNLVAFHVAVDTPAAPPRRKPPRAAARRAPPPAPRARLRSASAGRDKRSELRARYWALLFGDLQRAIGEIYNTVEAHENQNECQEVILVLENYTRDFKALGEWFRLKWEYDNTPPPQRPQSLAWEIRKTDFVRPESRRAYSVRSSPSVSGKNSPSLSGHNTPSGKNSPVTGKASPGSGKISPRVPGYSSTSPKANVEFFSNKIASKVATKPEPKVAKETRLSDIKEKEVKENCGEHDIDKQVLNETKDKIPATIDSDATDSSPEKIPTITEADTKICSEESSSLVESAKNTCSVQSPASELGLATKCIEKPTTAIELGKAKECQNIVPKPVIIKSAKQNIKSQNDITSQAKATISKLDEMENDFLEKNLVENKAKNDNMLNQDKELEKGQGDSAVYNNSGGSKAADCKESITSGSPVKSDDNFADVSNDSSPDIQPPDEKNNIPPKCKEQESSEKQINAKTDVPQDSQETLAESKEITKQKPEEQKPEPTNDKQISSDKDKSTNEREDQDAKKQDTKVKPIEIKPVENKPTRPAYSQAAAKPKAVTATVKPEVKPPIRTTTPIMRSRTVVEIPPNAPKSRQPYPKRNQTSNKCSYPFNLTTGRTSLFETPTNRVAPKKPIVRTGMGSGDTKVNQPAIKIDPKKRPSRPSSLKINEKGDKKEKVSTALEKIKDCEEYSSTDTIVTQIDLSRIESSESLKTLVPEELLAIPDAASSVEVLNVQNTKNDDEWLTVKSRRLSRESKKQSKSHWSNRFHQPSATTSLPTLNMIESPKQESKPIPKVGDNKFDRAKSEQPEMLAKPKPRTPKPKEAKPKMKDPAMIRQKSDVTGLKTRSSRNKVTRKSEKAKDANKTEGDLTKSRLHSSLESLTTGLERSQESTEDSFDFDKWKSEFKFTFKCFDDDDQIHDHNEILKSADPSEMSEIAEMTSLIEENERKISLALDFQSDADQRKLCEEEDLLNRQIMELQQVSDIDLDTETDDTETDAEILCEETNIQVPSGPSPSGLGALAASLEDQYEAALAGMSWAERVDTLVVLEALVARDPGRAQQLHAKLSQGIKRRGSLQDALRRLQAKQARAEKQRLEYQTERAKKIHQLLARVEEVKIAKNQLIEEKRLRLERRLQKAAENRDQHLKDIVRKAHDEEEKLREIAFIKQLEAENRRHDFLDQCRTHTTRLRQMRRDRLNKLEQKAAREAAVGARRQALEAARRRHVESLVERRRLNDARRQQLRDLQRQERDDAAREKAEGVKSRLSALAAAAELEADALRSRIRDKQDASQQRLESHLQAIREKATGPRQPTTSESEQAREEKELQEETERLEQERRDREKQKAIKKKARKVKQKLISTGCESAFNSENMPLEAIFPINNKIYKVIQQLANILNPLVDTECNEHKKTDKNEINNHTNSVDDVTDKQNKKNKNKTNNKLVNGTADGNKKIKKDNSADNPDIIEKVNETNAIENNNNNDMKTEIILENKAASDSNTKTDLKIEIMLDKRNLPDSKTTQDTKETTKDYDIIIENATNTNTDSPKPENNKKKAKKNKNNKEGDNKNTNDKPKLSKTNSVCSSLSDMSKASAKSEKKAKVVIDTAILDRLLNELHRWMEKFDKSTKDKGLAQKMQGLKVLGQLVAVAAERDDIAPQLSAKTLTTAVMIMSRVIGNCAMSAAYFVTTNTCVHTVRLLATTLEKDLQSDSRETELAKQLADCLSVALDSVLCSSRLYDDETADNREKDLLTALRGRTHTLISYLCLCGCVSKAEHAGDARDSMHTLLTVCSDVCYPCDADVGTERASATQSLRCALGTSICGARAELCSLFAATDTEQCAAFVRAARTAHLLRAAAILDHRIVQEAFGEGRWPLEFRAAVSRLLSQHAPNDRELPRTTYLRLSNQRLDQTLQETMVLDLIVLVGFVIVNNPQLQETICSGWGVIKTLCTVPAGWLVGAPACHALLPTLVALCQYPPAAAAIRSELSMQLLNDYMDSSEAQEVKLVQIIKQGRAKKPPTTVPKK